jgi:hypothetical protein
MLYQDLSARKAFFETHSPRAKSAEGVPYLDFDALAAYIKEQEAESAKVKLTLGFRAQPSQSISWHKSRLELMHRQNSISPSSEPQYDDHFHVALFKKRQQDAEYEVEAKKNEAEIEALKHVIAQFDRIKLLMEQSRRNHRIVTVKQWQDAAEGTDFLATNVEAAQHVEFSRRLEVGEIGAEVETQHLAKMFEQMRRDWH